MSFILSTNSHPQLAKQLSEQSKIPLIETNIQYFSNLEIRTSIGTSIRGKDIFIVTSPNTNSRSINDYIIETYLLIKTCRRSDAKNITLLCPSYPYARQDKKNNSRTCISAKDIADLFTTAGINRIVAFDLHSHQIQGFFNIPCDNFYCISMIYNYLVKYHNINDNFDIGGLNSKYVMVAPDEGALKRVQVYANKFKMPFMVISKERDYSQINKVERAVLIGNKKYLEGRTAIVIDDMVDTCGTIITVGNVLMEKGAKDMIVVATHGILSGPAIDRLNSNNFIKEIILSDSIPQNHNMSKCNKIKTFSIVTMLSQVINKLNNGGSLSDIFEFQP